MAKEEQISLFSEGIKEPPAINPKAYIEPYMVWENGNYIKKHRIAMRKEDVQELKLHAAQQMYIGDWDPVAQDYIVDERYVGMTKIEVAQHKQMDAAARGDFQALDKIEDRILGKPKQQVEAVQISATLEDFLEKVAQKEGLAPCNTSYLNDGNFIEGEVVGSSPSGANNFNSPPREDMDI